MERITSEPSQKSGMFDQFYYGYLGFELGPDDETLYYLTGGPIYIDGERVDDEVESNVPGVNAPENLHLITYNIPNREYTDHGPIFYEDGARPTYSNSIAIGPAGDVYTLANHERNGEEIQDLVRIFLSGSYTYTE